MYFLYFQEKLRFLQSHTAAETNFYSNTTRYKTAFFVFPLYNRTKLRFLQSHTESENKYFLNFNLDPNPQATQSTNELNQIHLTTNQITD